MNKRDVAPRKSRIIPPPTIVLLRGFGRVAYVMRRVSSLKANYLARPGVKAGPHSRGRNSDLLYFAVCCTLHISFSFPFSSLRHPDIFFSCAHWGPCLADMMPNSVPKPDMHLRMAITIVAGSRRAWTSKYQRL